LLGSDEAVVVRVDVTNTGASPLRAVRVAGDLIGGRAEAALQDLGPGGTGRAPLVFPYDVAWRPGLHVLPLRLRYTAADGAPAEKHALACLLVQIAGPATPALEVSAEPAQLDLRGALVVTLRSADARPHRARVRVLTPPGLVAPEPPPVVEVAAAGATRVDVPLAWGSAPRASRQGLLVVAEALEGPVERMAFAPAEVMIGPDPAWLPRLRAPLALAALLLLGAGLGAEARRPRA
jgi:hypothetical protein